MERLVYLHGFASGPLSKKARMFAERMRLSGRQVEVPDLAEGAFRDLTIGGQLQVINSVAGLGPVSLVGSSLGGYLAALYAARHPNVRRLVLLAPAFGFARRWADSLGEAKVRDWQATGVTRVMNYALGCETELGWQLLEDARRYEEEPDVRQPMLILHGTRDTVVPAEVSASYAATRPNVHLVRLDSDHELLDVFDTVWQEAERFLARA